MLASLGRNRSTELIDVSRPNQHITWSDMVSCNRTRGYLATMLLILLWEKFGW